MTYENPTNKKGKMQKEIVLGGKRGFIRLLIKLISVLWMKFFKPGFSFKMKKRVDSFVTTTSFLFVPVPSHWKIYEKSKNY